MKKLKVGATHSYTYTKEFWEAGLDLDIVPIDNLQIKKLLAGRIDVAPLKTMKTVYTLKQEGTLNKVYILPKPLTSRVYYNAFSKASTQPNKKFVMDNYDRIVRRMKKDGTIKRIFEKYFGKGVDLSY